MPEKKEMGLQITVLDRGFVYPHTKLDQAGTVVAPLRAVIHFLTCKTEW